MMIKKHDCSDHYCKGNHEKGPKNSNCQQKHLSFFPFATEVRNLSYLILSFVSAPSGTSSMKVAMLFPDLLIPTASLEKASLRQIDLVHKYKQKLAGYIFDGLPMFHASSYNQKMWLIYNKLTLMQVTAHLDRQAANPTLSHLDVKMHHEIRSKVKCANSIWLQFRIHQKLSSVRCTECPGSKFKILNCIRQWNVSLKNCKQTAVKNITKCSINRTTMALLLWGKKCLEFELLLFNIFAKSFRIGPFFSQ